MHLIKQLDQNLLDLAWSLWTELGVAGVKRRHQNVLILIEELILFTSVLAEIDPRLRDESIDWCSQYYHFVSISRLKSLMKNFDKFIEKSISQYAVNLNKISNTNWPVFMDTSPIKINLSRKSVLRPHESSALLNIRARSLFGTGARADLITFFLVHPDTFFSIAEVTEIGYSKRNLAEVLNDLHFSNLFDKSMQGNQQRYRLKKNSALFQVLIPIPQYAPSWLPIFRVLLSLRTCLQRIENSSESTKVVEIRNCLKQHEKLLKKLELMPPPFQNSFPAYLIAFSQWILDWSSSLVKNEK